MHERQSLINQLWRDNRWLWFLPGVVVGFLIGLPIQLSGEKPTGWFIEGIWPEMLGAAFTVIVIDRLYRHREEQRKITELKEQLVRRAGSKSNEIAKDAVSELSKRGWLQGKPSLLYGADLYGAWLQRASFWQANLQRAFLRYAHLENADLRYADLQEAHLRYARLQGTILQETNLQGVNLTDAVFDTTTILPDGTNWTPETDMTRFTDPKHPNFWRSDDPDSPAYARKD